MTTAVRAVLALILATIVAEGGQTGAPPVSPTSNPAPTPAILLIFTDDLTMPFVRPLVGGFQEALAGRSTVVYAEFFDQPRFGDEIGRAAVDAAAELHPELVVLDISMPRMNGLEAAAEMSRWPQAPAIVFLTVHAEAGFLEAARTLGAAGYVLKGSMATDLVPAIYRALARPAA